MHFSLLIFLLVSMEPWGKDSDLNKKPAHAEKIAAPSVLGDMSDSAISFYQKFITQIDGPRSKFRPTSSRYAQLAIHRYGFLKGYIMGCDRLLRENNEKWIYDSVAVGDTIYKYDPAIENKRQ